MCCTISNIKRFGGIMAGLVMGVGTLGVGKFRARVDGVATKEYRLWEGMITRCYSNNVHSRQPCYTNSRVSEEFLNFQYFAEWCQHQIGFLQGYDLDKDFVSETVGIYSENTCVFIPRKINTFSLSRRKERKHNLPEGVMPSNTGKKFAAIGLVDGVRKRLGVYDTPEEAFEAVNNCKIVAANKLADEFDGLVDERVIKKLRSFSLKRS